MTSWFSVLDHYRELWGQHVIIPLAEAIRFAVEGPDAPRTPLAEVRFLQPKNSPLFDPTSIGLAFCVALLFCILEPIVRNIVSSLFCKPFEMSRKDNTRFTESIWQLLFYTFSWIFCCFIVYDAPWFYHTYLCWEEPFPNQSMELSVYIMYILQIGWYLHCVWSHVMHDVRKSDFYMMLVHHIAALVLLYSAFATGYHRCGILCLFSLDGCDIFLHFTKCTRLVDNYRSLSMFVAIGTYSSVVFSWIIFRLYIFAIKVLYTASFQGLHYGGWKNSDYWFFYNSLLLVIYALQIYWFYLILLTGYKFVRFGDRLDDERDKSVQKHRQKQS